MCAASVVSSDERDVRVVCVRDSDTCIRCASNTSNVSEDAYECVDSERMNACMSCVSAL